MENFKFWPILIGLAIGAFGVYLLCCRHKCPDHGHKTHIFKIWKGYVEPDTSSESEFVGLTKVKFLEESYYFDNKDGNKEVPRGLVFVFIAKKVPLEGSPYERKIISTESADNTVTNENNTSSIDILYIADKGYLDEDQEAFSCPNTGRTGCFNVVTLDSVNSRIVTRDNIEKILLVAPAYLHRPDGSGSDIKWVTLEFTREQFGHLKKNIDPANKGCNGLMLDHQPKKYRYDNNEEIEVYDNWRFDNQ